MLEDLFILVCQVILFIQEFQHTVYMILILKSQGAIMVCCFRSEAAYHAVLFLRRSSPVLEPVADVSIRHLPVARMLHDLEREVNVRLGKKRNNFVRL